MSKLGRKIKRAQGLSKGAQTKALRKKWRQQAMRAAPTATPGTAAPVVRGGEPVAVLRPRDSVAAAAFAARAKKAGKSAEDVTRAVLRSQPHVVLGALAEGELVIDLDNGNRVVDQLRVGDSLVPASSVSAALARQRARG